MKRTINLLSASLFSILSLAQVPKTVVVEHFTNTRCSICASRNPGFYNNLSNQADALHVAFHPSSPYSNCFLNNQNPTENDDRTRYYGLYGSTPKFTIQGDVVPSSQNVSNPSLFNPYNGQTTEASVKVLHDKSSGSSIKVDVVVKTEAIHSYGNLRLFVALVEDTVAYNAPNGEDFHYDVFRKTLTDIEGDVLTLPTNVGDSLSFSFTENLNTDWSASRIYAIAILQVESDKAVVQSAASESEGTGNPVGIAEKEENNFKVFPNPVSDRLNVQIEEEVTSIRVMSITGRQMYYSENVKESVHQIDVSDYNKGLYFLDVLSNGNHEIRKVTVY